MIKLPLLRAREIEKILRKLGFGFKRREGSHMFFKHPDVRTTVIPDHQGEEIDRGHLNKIIKHDLNMNREEFLRLVK